MTTGYVWKKYKLARGGVTVRKEWVANRPTPDAVRTVYEGERTWLVTPVTMVVAELLMNGSLGPVVYPANELARSCPAWEGAPVTFDHPELTDAGDFDDDLEATLLGEVRNARMRGRKQVAEAWLDPRRCRAVAPEILDALARNEKVEVSVGVMVRLDAGNRASGIVPHHLAVLPPDAVGACSVADGCGLLAHRRLVMERRARAARPRCMSPDPITAEVGCDACLAGERCYYVPQPGLDRDAALKSYLIAHGMSVPADEETILRPTATACPEVPGLNLRDRAESRNKRPRR